jgi:hypothetical protein
MDAWFQEQKNQGRAIEFMHLDSLVRWISNSRLLNELRLALRDNNINVPE